MFFHTSVRSGITLFAILITMECFREILHLNVEQNTSLFDAILLVRIRFLSIQRVQKRFRSQPPLI